MFETPYWNIKPSAYIDDTICLINYFIQLSFVNPVSVEIVPMSNLSYCQSKRLLMVKSSMKQILKIDWPVKFPNILTKYFSNQLQNLRSIEPTKLALIYIYGTEEEIRQSLKHNFLCDSEGLVEMYRVKRWPFTTLPPTISNLIKYRKWKSENLIYHKEKLEL